MKKYLFLVLIALFTTSAAAQDAMLTKEETVNYINKKMQEIDGRYSTVGSNKLYYSAASFKLEKDKVLIEYTDTSKDFCPNYTRKFSYSFDPADIKNLTVSGKDSDPVRTINIKFSAATGRAREDHSPTSSECGLGFKGGTLGTWADFSYAELPYFATSPENLNRIGRALLHLRDLAKAEDDPFGN